MTHITMDVNLQDITGEIKMRITEYNVYKHYYYWYIRVMTTKPGYNQMKYLWQDNQHNTIIRQKITCNWHNREARSVHDTILKIYVM